MQTRGFFSKRVALAIAATTLWSGIAFAATGVQLTNVQGGVTVDGAPGASGGLKVGDVVSAPIGGSATIVFADGCSVTLAGASSVTIGDISPCKLAANGGNVGTAGAGLSPTLITGSVVVVAVGGAAIVIAVTNKSPSSP